MTLPRRTFLRLAAPALALLATSAHTPYRQWQVYRQKHLLIGTSKADAASYPLGKRLAAALARHLPESSARVTRGPDAWRLASLITSGQLDVVLLADTDVTALRDGAPPFEAFGPVELRALVRLGDYLLVTRPDFPDRHAWLVAKTLARHELGLSEPREAVPRPSPIPVHPGVLAYAAGEPEPAASDVPGDVALPIDHVH